MSRFPRAQKIFATAFIFSLKHVVVFMLLFYIA